MWSLSGDFGRVDLKNIQTTLEDCAKQGYTEFDVAPVYGIGFMESCLGNVFGGDNTIKISTKCGNHILAGKDFSVEALRRSLDNSLKRLKRDSVHTLFLHNPRTELDRFEGVLEFMEKEKNNGRITYGGISAAKGFPYDPETLRQFDALQDDANLLYLDAIESRPRPKKYFYVRSPLASGILSGNMTRETVFAQDDCRSQWLKGERLISIMKRVDEIRKRTDLPLPNLARRFVLDMKEIDKVIFGVKSSSHLAGLEQDICAEPLPEKLVHELIQLYRQDFGLPSAEKHLGY